MPPRDGLTDEDVQREAGQRVMAAVKSGDAVANAEAREAHIVARLKEIEENPYPG